MLYKIKSHILLFVCVVALPVLGSQVLAQNCCCGQKQSTCYWKLVNKKDECGNNFGHAQFSLYECSCCGRHESVEYRDQRPNPCPCSGKNYYQEPSDELKIQDTEFEPPHDRLKYERNRENPSNWEKEDRWNINYGLDDNKIKPESEMQLCQNDPDKKRSEPEPCPIYKGSSEPGKEPEPKPCPNDRRVREPMPETFKNRS